MWYRLYRKDGEEVGEIIAHDDIKIIQDHRMSFEKRVFEDLAIYKLQVKLIFTQLMMILMMIDLQCFSV